MNPLIKAFFLDFLFDIAKSGAGSHGCSVSSFE